jgi:ABC-type molybdenum transport system ATPase subunit/photorepair protein PhrA
MNNYAFELENVSVGYDQKLVLEKLSLKVGAGKMAAVPGPNGAGKSTLFPIPQQPGDGPMQGDLPGNVAGHFRLQGNEAQRRARMFARRLQQRPRFPFNCP